MRKIPALNYWVLGFFILAAGCSMPSLYTDSNKISVGALNAKEWSDLKLFFKPYTHGKLQDTLIIKYEINGESCWEFLDKQTDEYVNRVIAGGVKYRDSVMRNRPTVSFFHFQEKGKQKNKIISWDSTVNVDVAGKLKEILFKEKTVCGSSAVVLPDGIYILIKSDSHLLSFTLSKDKIGEALKTKHIKNLVDLSGR